MDPSLEQNSPTIGSGTPDMPVAPSPDPINSPINTPVEPAATIGQSADTIGGDTVGETIGAIEQETTTTSEPAKSESGKSKKKIIIIGAIAAAVVALGAVAALLVLPKLKNGGQKLSGARANDAFFVDESRDTYKAALFNNDGKQLSEFIYTDYSDFVGGYAKVKNADTGEVSVIDTQGKESIKAGKYKTIDAYNGFYIVSDGAKNQLVTAGDQVLTDVSDAGTALTFQGGVAAIVVQENGNQYSVYNLNGDRLAQFNSSTTPTIVYDESKLADTAFIFAEHHVYVIDNRDYSLKMDADIERTYSRINEASKTQRAAILSGDTDFAYYYNGKLFDIKNGCDKVYLTKTSTASSHYNEDQFLENAEAAVCDVDYNKFLISSDDGSISTATMSYNGAFFSADTYIATSYGSGGWKTELYRNNEKVKDMTENGYMDISLGVDNIWNISAEFTHGDDPSTYAVWLYDFDGKQLFTTKNTEDEQLAAICGVYATHQQDRAIVRLVGLNEDGKSKCLNEYYLLDTKNNKFLTGAYTKIFSQIGYFIAVDGYSDRYKILSADGEPLTDATYEKIDISHTGFVVAKRINKGPVDIVKTLNRDIIASADSYSGIMVKNGNYLRVTSDGKNQFYTLSGELFYTQE